ncbi:hypothetical protein MHTCC0001_16560 [Flavobacteriaceae bacterium MHTCC 0001]
MLSTCKFYAVNTIIFVMRKLVRCAINNFLKIECLIIKFKKMKNLELINLEVLNKNEQMEINGGIVCAGACMFIIGVVVGAGLAYLAS